MSNSFTPLKNTPSSPIRTVKYAPILVLLLAFLFQSACGEQGLDAADFRGTVLPTPIPAADFTLQNAAGEDVHLSDYEGQIVLLYFGYTFCPDICPTTLAELAKVQSELDDVGEKIQVIMVTVDPERDTPEQLAQYVTHFHPDFVGLSGAKEAIDAAADTFGVYYQRNEGSEATGYLVDHTARVFVVDPQGNYMLSFAYGTPVEDIVHDVKLLMRSL
ncbi:MAG: SCO family protein [Candidatus Promineifilaceae bacterium]